MNIFITSSRDP